MQYKYVLDIVSLKKMDTEIYTVSEFKSSFGHYAVSNVNENGLSTYSEWHIVVMLFIIIVFWISHISNRCTRCAYE